MGDDKHERNTNKVVCHVLKQRRDSSNRVPTRELGVFTNRTCSERDRQIPKGLMGQAEGEDGISREARRSEVTWPLVYAAGGPCKAT